MTKTILTMAILGLALGILVRAAVLGPGSPAPEATPSPPALSANRGPDVPPVNAFAGIEGFVDLANATCPIMNGAVPEGGGSTLVYNGVLVHFCCDGCDGEFLKDPLRHLKALAAAGAPVPPGLLTAEGNPPLIVAGNRTCPIMKRPIDRPPGTGAFVVHRGVRVDICCPPCKEKFARAPLARLREAAAGTDVPEERLR